ncbi:MAG: hypothetical protein KA536_23065 [Saprospiraceae bacterium]|nr:hypothetical protein [Saprospiraceae bacterium]
MNNLSFFSVMGRVFPLFLFFFLTLNLSSQNQVEVVGQIKITGGSPMEGKVLTSDNAGLATWQNPTGVAQQYAYVYNLSSQNVPVEADIIFDSNTNLTSGFVHVPGTTTINIINTGIYKVSFSVSSAEPNQFALFLNGSVLSGSIFGSGAGTQQNNGALIFSATAGDVVSLRNHSSAAAVTLASNVGGTQANVNASLIFQKL